ncbi:hypothetical protein [Nakamurella lactea]|uniref:hypothetical protein n=1 Tax=Nakamurella lactea TaxID=459515 RepID=UPI00042749B9|nr:hypothetical protein [Nakamurella lactea]
MTHSSRPELLTLHAVRLLGFADTAAITRRYCMDPARTAALLEDFQVRGWVERAAFADLAGWSLRESGRQENERRLAAELDQVGAGDEVRAVYRDFLPLNTRLQKACTRWQLRPTPGDPLAVNDHSDPAWDDAVLDELAAIHRGLTPLAERLGGSLTRFRSYDPRFAAALQQAWRGDGGWVDRTDLDSCHRVWFELHEDLIATLGLVRHP